MIERIAPAMHLARYFGFANPEQAMAIALKGWELGFSISGSFEFIHAITASGKTVVTLSPRGMLALMHSSPKCKSIEIVEKNDDKGDPFSCTVTITRDNGYSHTVTWTMDDARRAGLVKVGGAWETYPANLLRWRAIGFCADIVCSDLLGGMKRADEFGANITAEGDVIDGSWTETKPSQQEEPYQAQVDTLESLVTEFGVPAVCAANGGMPPVGDQLAKVGAILRNAKDKEAEASASVDQQIDTQTDIVIPSLGDLVRDFGANEVVAANGGKMPSTEAERQEIHKVLSNG